VLAVFFYSWQTKQTELLVKSVQDAQSEIARQQFEGEKDRIAGKSAAQQQMMYAEKKDKEKRIDTLVTELVGRYRDSTIADVNAEPIDDWVSRPLVVSLFPLKINGHNSEAYQDVILSNIAEHFGASDRVRLVDRDLIDKLLEELNLSSSDLADKQTALRIGKLVGARFIVSGSVFSIGEEIKVSTKLIETETTSIVKTRTQSCTGPDSLSVLAEVISGELIGALVNKFPLQARIIGFADDSVVINIGKDHGMVKGTKLDVYQEQNIEGSNATIKKKVGTIEVKDVDKDVSTGSVLSKTVEFGKNMKLREVL
jgi:TolB-like protein